MSSALDVNEMDLDVSGMDERHGPDVLRHIFDTLLRECKLAEARRKADVTNARSMFVLLAKIKSGKVSIDDVELDEERQWVDVNHLVDPPPDQGYRDFIDLKEAAKHTQLTEAYHGPTA